MIVNLLMVVHAFCLVYFDYWDIAAEVYELVYKF